MHAAAMAGFTHTSKTIAIRRPTTSTRIPATMDLTLHVIGLWIIMVVIWYLTTKLIARKELPTSTGFFTVNRMMLAPTAAHATSPPHPLTASVTAPTVRATVGVAQTANFATGRNPQKTRPTNATASLLTIASMILRFKAPAQQRAVCAIRPQLLPAPRQQEPATGRVTHPNVAPT